MEYLALLVLAITVYLILRNNATGDQYLGKEEDDDG